MSPRLRLAAIVSAALAFALTTGTGVAEAAFDAHGSARQVYATGLGSKASVTLIDKHGRKVATKRADAEGGVLFRNVKPGTGYRLRLAKGGAKSGPLTVLSTKA